MYTQIHMTGRGLEDDFLRVITGVISRRMHERAGAVCSQDEDAYRIALAYDPSLTNDGYRIADAAGGVCIQSGSRCGLLAVADHLAARGGRL